MQVIQHNIKRLSKYTYTQDGSKTTSTIEDAPQVVQRIWKELHDLGVAIFRHRKDKKRWKIDTGDTFTAIHVAKSSFYIPNENTTKPLHFVRKTAYGKDNKGMKVLEVASNMDCDDVFRHIDLLEDILRKIRRPNIFIRFINFVKSLFS